MEYTRKPQYNGWEIQSAHTIGSENWNAGAGQFAICLHEHHEHIQPTNQPHNHTKTNSE